MYFVLFCSARLSPHTHTPWLWEQASRRAAGFDRGWQRRRWNRTGERACSAVVRGRSTWVPGGGAGAACLQAAPGHQAQSSAAAKTPRVRRACVCVSFVPVCLCPCVGVRFRVSVRVSLRSCQALNELNQQFLRATLLLLSAVAFFYTAVPDYGTAGRFCVCSGRS